MNLICKKTNLGLITLFCIVLAFSASAFAVPTLQLGAPGVSGEGTYADYTDRTNPTESHTAVTSGTSLLVAGAYNAGQTWIGGYHSGSDVSWSDLGFISDFDGSGAILMATVSDGTLGTGTLTINGGSLIYSTSTYADAFEPGYFDPDPLPGIHAPTAGQDYMFFDIGSFEPPSLNNDTANVPDFDLELGFEAVGEVKDLVISTSGYQWIHFDLFAMETIGSEVEMITTADSGSNDLTYKSQPIPEPGTFLLLGSGLIGFWYTRKKIVG